MKGATCSRNFSLFPKHIISLHLMRSLLPGSVTASSGVYIIIISVVVAALVGDLFDVLLILPAQ